MQIVRFIHWKDGEWFIGYLTDYPYYCMQGESLEDLKLHLVDLYHDLPNGELKGIHPGE